MALIEAGYNNADVLFDPEAQEVVYLNNCEAALHEDSLVG